MFLIFGLRTTAQRMGLMPGTCRACGQHGSLVLLREVTKLSLFFVPLVPVRTRFVAQCSNPGCGARFGVGADEARRLLAI